MTTNFIVTTTIHTPSKAICKFASLKDWTLIVVGDLKTPHDAYKTINCIYLHPKEQEVKGDFRKVVIISQHGEWPLSPVET